MRITRGFRDFFQSESSSGILLIVLTIITLLTTNFVLHEQYAEFWESNFLGKSLEFWINDVLMTFFFLTVGLEIEREIYVGELSNLKQALLPIFAAIGGMIVPALIYISINAHSGSISGFGIPMATDIAFSLTILTIVASKIPSTLKVFLTALAIIDDIGAIIVIAVFYTKDFSMLFLVLAFLIILLLFLFNRFRFKNIFLYLIPGIFIWICLYKSGIHPTITGVILAFLIPFGKGDKKSPSYIVEEVLNKPVAYIILPLFVIANTGILMTSNDFSQLLTVNSLGIILGLVIGKPLGITLFSWVAVKYKICSLFEHLTMQHIFGAGIIAGIGFTMSIFIALLAFENPDTIKISKLSIIVASFISAILGIIYISVTYFLNEKKRKKKFLSGYTNFARTKS